MTDGPSHRSESFHLEHCFQICQLRFRCELRNLAQADEKHQKEQQLHRSSRLTSSSSSSTLLMPTADSSTHLNFIICNNQWPVTTTPRCTNLGKIATRRKERKITIGTRLVGSTIAKAQGSHFYSIWFSSKLYGMCSHVGERGDCYLSSEK